MPGTALGTGSSVVGETEMLPALMELMSGREEYRLTEPSKHSVGPGTVMPYVEATSRSSRGRLETSGKAKHGKQGSILGLVTWTPGCTKASLEGPVPRLPQPVSRAIHRSLSLSLVRVSGHLSTFRVPQA